MREDFVTGQCYTLMKGYTVIYYKSYSVDLTERYNKLVRLYMEKKLPNERRHLHRHEHVTKVFHFSETKEPECLTSSSDVLVFLEKTVGERCFVENCKLPHRTANAKGLIMDYYVFLKDGEKIWMPSQRPQWAAPGEQFYSLRWFFNEALEKKEKEQ